MLSRSNLFVLFFLTITVCICYYRYQQPLGDEAVLSSSTVEGVLKNQKKKKDFIELTIGSVLIYTDTPFSLGDTLTCQGKIEYPDSKTNFYLFDYQKYLASKKIYYIMNGDCTRKKKNSSFWYGVKNQIIQVIEKRKSSRYLKTFLLGSTEEIEDSVLTSYQKNGISHLFAVSGMHIQFFFLLFSFFPKKKKKRVFLFLFLFFYAFLVSFTPSFLRAWLFPFFSQLGEKLRFSKKQSFLLFTSLFLLINPYYFYHTGFLYSFIIGFFLLFWQKEMVFQKHSLFFLSLLCFFASLPIQINTNFSVSLLGIIFNLVFVPLVSGLLFPLSFLAFLFPWVDSFYHILMTILENSSLFLAHYSPNYVFPYIPLWGVICYFAYFLFLLHKIKKKEYKYIVVFLFLLLLFRVRPFLNKAGEVVMLDVGQGDSILLLYPYQKISILVDTGGTKNEGKIASRILVPTLHAYGISKLDFLVLTHGDQDHMGDAISLLKSIPVKQVLLNSGTKTKLEEVLLSYMREKKIAYRQISKGTVSYRGETLSFLNSQKEEENEDSLVLLVKMRNHPILLMGDSGFQVEQELLEEGNLLKVDLLKVGHHGSKYSTSIDFLKKIQPKICMISAGVHNRYSHPHEETLNRLQSCDTYVTSKGGAIKVRLNSSLLVQRVR